MANFEGYLLKSTANNVKFPEQYINEESYDSTPNQREEIKAYRDENTRNLTRVTAQGKKSKIVFKTRDGLHLSEKKAVQSWFTTAETNHEERKIQITFWNDEDNEYKTGYFYRPDIKFTIKKHTNNDIIYKELEITLVEY